MDIVKNQRQLYKSFVKFQVKIIGLPSFLAKLAMVENLIKLLTLK